MLGIFVLVGSGFALPRPGDHRVVTGGQQLDLTAWDPADVGWHGQGFRADVFYEATFPAEVGLRKPFDLVLNVTVGRVYDADPLSPLDLVPLQDSPLRDEVIAVLHTHEIMAFAFRSSDVEVSPPRPINLTNTGVVQWSVSPLGTGEAAGVIMPSYNKRSGGYRRTLLVDRDQEAKLDVAFTVIDRRVGYIIFVSLLGLGLLLILPESFVSARDWSAWGWKRFRESRERLRKQRAEREEQNG